MEDKLPITDFYFDLANLEHFFTLCEKGKELSPEAEALRIVLEKRGYDLERGMRRDI